MIKKTISVISVICLLLTLVGTLTVSASEEVNDKFDDCVNVLKGYGLISSDEYLSDEHLITRAELANVIADLAGENNQVHGNGSFEDVTEDTPYYEDINMMLDMGIISQSDKYYPDDYATYEQAVKMIMSLAGYEEYAQYNGGYPQGYIKPAQEQGLLSGITPYSDGRLTGRLLVSLVFNSLDMHIMERDNRTMSVSDTETVLSKFHDGYRIKGIMTKNGYTSLTSAAGVFTETIEVGGVLIKDAGNSAAEQLGMEIYAYCRENNGEYTLVYSFPTSKNKYIDINAEYLLTDSSRYSKQKLVYEDSNGKEKDLIIDSEADVIYNYIAEPEFTVETISPDSGRIRVIDNDSDGLYDVVIVDETENIVVESVANNIIYDKYGKTLDLNDCKNVVMKSMYGDSVSIDRISEWNVLSVVKSKDNNAVYITVYDDPVKGEVESIRPMEDYTEITIDGDTFKVAKSYEDAVENSKGGAIGIKLGMYGVFYLDDDERIAAYNSMNEASSSVVNGNTAWQYAYLVNGAYDENEDKLIIKVLMDKNGMDKFEIVNRTVIIDNKKYQLKDAYEYLKIDENGNSESGIYQQLIRIKMNGEGIVTNIDTAKKSAGEGDDSLKLNVNNESMYYSIRTGRFGNAESFGVRYDPKVTVILKTPKNDKTNPEKYLYEMDLDNNANVTIKAYDCDFSGTARFITMEYDDSNEVQTTIKNLRSITIVDGLGETVGNDGDIHNYINGFDLNGNGVELILDSDVNAEDISKGDIITYTLDYKEQVDYLEKWFDYDKDMEYMTAEKLINATTDYTAAFSGNASAYICKTIITGKSGNVIQVPAPGTDFGNANFEPLSFENKQVYSLDKAVIYSYDRTVTKISPNELEEYIYERSPLSRVVLFTNYTDLAAVYVYPQ